MSPREFFEQQRLQFIEEGKRKITQLRENDKLIDTMPTDQLRAWIRFLLDENFRLQTDVDRLTDLVGETKT